MRKHKQNWLDIFTGFRVALDARKIILGTLGAYISIFILLGLLSLAARWSPGAKTVMGDFVQAPVSTTVALLRCAPDKAAAILCDLRDPAGAGLALRKLAFMAAGGLLLLFTWSFIGGAMARIAAVDFARGERPRIGEATSFAAEKFGSFFWAPLVPLIFVILFLLCNVVLGLVGRIPGAGPIVMGLFFTLAAVSAFLVLLLLIGTFFGFIFMWPTIAMEGTDAFDAISRAFNYLYARPWKTIWCSFMASVYGAAVIAFVAAFTGLLLRIALGSVALGMGSEFSRIGRFVNEGFGAEGIGIPGVIGMLLVKVALVTAWGLILGFIASYKVSAMTIIYSVLRRDVDGTDMDEAFMPEAEAPQEEPSAEPLATEPKTEPPPDEPRPPQ